MTLIVVSVFKPRSPLYVRSSTNFQDFPFISFAFQKSRLTLIVVSVVQRHIEDGHYFWKLEFHLV